MEMTKAGKIHYLKPELGDGLTAAGFTTRHEGVSRPPYNSLNLGTNTLDSPHNVEGNRSLLARAFGGTLERFLTVTQVHGTDLLMIDAPNPEFDHFLKLECDGIVTNQPGLMIAICVADCVPVLLHDPVQGVAAALHAGWKGTAGNIAGKGVEAMVKLFGSQPGDIRAAIGPCIHSCCYEVDQPVKEAFQAAGAPWELCATEKERGKWNLDLAAANRWQLKDAGLPESRIDTSEHCVCCDHDLFFSHRRDSEGTGRQVGFIML
ncbi:peptidoglycan editing factor PgeF [Geomesophilobacter sediminis]|uniref:Purine nucleoside phosphorylase n=1 Tax=Geomesophilobacter sediminis TaxID=2798584 RepID=A0A8J7S7J8_9BACT|nr:peptidoglycan editing factor PgeF [Geomesophilobacter sediminis]MBJ6727076.1 peptidoglycan editing factor PgeF [Geomesophilobacter sediminis]